jgi:hypothetical protein
VVDTVGYWRCHDHSMTPVGQLGVRFRGLKLDSGISQLLLCVSNRECGVRGAGRRCNE